MLGSDDDPDESESDGDEPSADGPSYPGPTTVEEKTGAGLGGGVDVVRFVDDEAEVVVYMMASRQGHGLAAVPLSETAFDEG